MKNSFYNLCLCIIFIILLFFSMPSHQDLFPPLSTPNPRLVKAYIALQAWKLAMVSDPNKFTDNWWGPDVCNYTGVYCAPAPDDPHALTVATIDLNHADIVGFLPEQLGLLKDLAIFHINSNRFFGTLPKSFIHLHLLYELDISNNQFGGVFPYVVLHLPSLVYLDIRFNFFKGEIPPELFDLKLDALFLNDNKFVSALPANLGNSPVSVFVLANNVVGSCIPSSLARMGPTLDEIILSNLGLTSCLSDDIGMLRELRVLDVSFNKLSGTLPETVGEMKNLEQLNVAHNKLSGRVPQSICNLPGLENFIYSYNYFNVEPLNCLKLQGNDDRGNCLPTRPLQRSLGECRAFYAFPPINCAGSCSPQ